MFKKGSFELNQLPNLFVYSIATFYSRKIWDIPKKIYIMKQDIKLDVENKFQEEN